MTIFNFGKKNQGIDGPGTPIATDAASPGPVPRSDLRPAANAPNAINFIRDQVLIRIEPAVAVKMTQEALTTLVYHLITEIANE